MITRVVHAKKPRALIAALAITLALATPTLGATATTTETLTVNSQITMTGVPATIAYGAFLAGDTVTAPSFPVVISGNTATGWSFTLAASNFASSGGFTFNSTARRITTSGGVGATLVAPYNVVGGAAYPGPANTAVVLATSSGPVSSTVSVALGVAIPAAAGAGNYTGSVTFTATANP